jgi:hypothetical protein
MQSARSSGLLAHGSRSIVDWFTGTGFLTVHATAFFVALVTLIPWNVYSSPGDFWSADLLVRWAFLVGFHALLVAVWSLIRHVVLADDRPEAAMTPTERTWHSARARSAAGGISFRTAAGPNPAAAQSADALIAEEWARQQRTAVLPEPEPSPASDPAETSILDDWDMSWPELAASGDDDTLAQVWPPPPEPAEPATEAEPAQPPAATADPGPPPRASGPLAAAARAGEPAAAGEPVDPELEWRWIEAAASAWLTRKERETLTDRSEYPPRSDRDAAAPGS